MAAFGEMPNLVPLLKVQEMVSNGELTVHQIVMTNAATKGKLVHMLTGCDEAYEKYVATHQRQAFFNHVFCAALQVCEPKVQAFMGCVNKVSAAVEARRHHQQFGGPAPPPMPNCARIKQDLEKCALRFSSTVVEHALENA